MNDPLFSNFKFTKPSVIRVSHDHGFFSCCSVILRLVIKHIKETNAMPLNIDISNSFTEYKNCLINDSLSEWFQYCPKKKLKMFQSLDFLENDVYDFDPSFFEPIVSKFFEPNKIVQSIVKSLKQKYSINDSNTVAFYYRGTDKKTEISLPDKKIFYKWMNYFASQGYTLLVQSDEHTFTYYARKKFPESVVVIDELKSRNSEKHDAKILLATVVIMSKCEYLFMNTSNVSLWTLLYRQNNNNVFQIHPDKSKQNFFNLKTKELLFDYNANST